MKAEQLTRQADDGVGLPAYRWRPEEGTSARGVLLISHGLAEHGARYEPVAAKLTDAGYLVYAVDHRGHGRYVTDGEPAGFFGPEGGWPRILKDLHLQVGAVQSEHPDLPLFLLGQSMGSMLLQEYMYTHGETIQGAVLFGSAGKPPALAQVGRLIARLERARQGQKGYSWLIDKLAFGKFNQEFQPSRTAFDWLSRDPAQVDAYVDDPLCGFLATNQLWVDLLDAYAALARPENQARVPKDLPVFIMAGSEDPVSEGTKSLKQLLGAYERAGLRRVEHRFYEGGRHEMLNETNQAEVIDDLLKWLEARIGELPDS